MFIKEQCSPRKNNVKNSCLSKELLVKIAKIFNKKKDANIQLKNISKKKLFDEISKYINKSTCNKESCWINIDSIMDGLSNIEIEKMKESFRPEKPKKWKSNPNTWLTTEDIDNVMEQYEKEFKNFKYFGATPIDFHLKNGKSCLISDLCNINIKEIKNNNKTCIGMVFNTDPHNKGGQHWFSMYVDLVGKNMPKPAIYYFDSASPVNNFEDISQPIINLMYKIEEQCDFKLDIFYNNIKHQNGNTECGMYCLHFLTEMLKGINFKGYLSRDLDDKIIEQFRNVFFIK
tara:strand:- start:689 stop:1552 length:864 start_codon:yes stop_codon:yes gene_type:complete